MIDPASFFKALGVFTLIIAFVVGVGYWVVVAVKKNFPNLKYQIKYKVFRKKHDPEIVALLMEDIEAGVKRCDIGMSMLVAKGLTYDQTMEILYIHDQIKSKMKGGIKNE